MVFRPSRRGGKTIVLNGFFFLIVNSEGKIVEENNFRSPSYPDKVRDIFCLFSNFLETLKKKLNNKLNIFLSVVDNLQINLKELI